MSSVSSMTNENVVLNETPDETRTKLQKPL
jgi:hypothetical protein